MPNTSAEQALIEAWRTPIYRLALQQLGNEADALDATQEACLALLRDHHQLRAPDKLRAWVYQIAHNVIRKQLRGSIARRKREARVRARSRPQPPLIDASLEARERHAILRRQVADLPEKTRSVVILHYYHGLSEREIAAVLELPRSTVQYRLGKGLSSLRSSLTGAGAAAFAPDIEPLLRALPWPEAPASLKPGALIAAAAGALTTGTIVMKIKIAAAAIAIAALSFGGLAFSQVIPAAAPPPPKISAPRLAPPFAPPPSDRRRLARLEAAREALAERARGLDAENARLAEKLAALAAPPPRASPTPFELPKGWKELGAKGLKALLLSMRVRGPEAYPAAEAMLADGHELIFAASYNPSSLSDSDTAPSLRTALIFLLGEIGGEAGRARVRALLEAEPGLAEVFAAQRVLDPEAAPGSPLRPLIIAALNAAMARDTPVNERWRRERRAKIASLSKQAREELEKRFKPFMVGPSGPDRILAGAPTPMTPTWPEDVLERYGAEEFRDAVRERLRSGVYDSIELYDLLDPEAALADLSELIGDQGPPMYRYERFIILRAMARLAHPPAYALLLERYPQLTTDERAELIQAVHRRCTQQKADGWPLDTSPEQARAGIDFLQAIAGQSPGRDYRGASLRHRIRDAMSRIRSAQRQS